MDNNKKHTLQKGKVNLVDGLIFVLVVIVLFALVLIGSFVIQNQPQEDNQSIETNGYLTYTVAFYNLKSEDVDNIKTFGSENPIKDFIHERNFGIIEGEPAIKTYEESDRIDVTVNIKVECVYASGLGYFIDGEQIRIGSTMNLLINESEYAGYCIGLAFEEQEEVAQ